MRSTSTLLALVIASAVSLSAAPTSAHGGWPAFGNQMRGPYNGSAFNSSASLTAPAGHASGRTAGTVALRWRGSWKFDLFEATNLLILDPVTGDCTYLAQQTNRTSRDVLLTKSSQRDATRNPL